METGARWDEKENRAVQCDLVCAVCTYLMRDRPSSAEHLQKQLHNTVYREEKFHEDADGGSVG